MKSSFHVHRSNLLYKNNLKGLYFKNHPAKVKYGVIMEISTEAVAQRCSVKKMFLKVSQNSQENICARDCFLIKSGLRPATLLKKSLWHRCFPADFMKFLRTPFFLKNTSGGRFFIYLFVINKSKRMKQKKND